MGTTHAKQRATTSTFLFRQPKPRKWLNSLADHAGKTEILAKWCRTCEAYANKHLSGGQRGEVRRMWILINETVGEVYALGDGAHATLHAVDLDFNHKSKMTALRRAALDKLTDEEMQALGLSRE